MPKIDDAIITARLDDATAFRGRHYALEGRVLDAEWNESANALTGQVQGGHPRPYRCMVLFHPSSTQSIVLASTCTCPMRQDCKHVAALLYSVAEDGVSKTEHVRSATAPSWRTQLGRLMQDDGDRSSPSTNQPRTLGLELRLELPMPTSRYHEGRSKPGLLARPVVHSSRGRRWVQGGTNWKNLGYSRDAGTPEQRALLRQLAALHAIDVPYMEADAWLHLDRVSAPIIWDVLAQVVAADIELVMDTRQQAQARLMPRPIDTGIDIIKRDGDLLVGVPVIVDADPVDAARIGFIGSPATGVFVWDVGVDGDPIDLRLGRLTLGLDDAAMALATQPAVRVPQDEIEAFTREALPALRAHHSVASHDGSFELPALPHPVLELQIHHSGPARAELTWQWRYVIDGDHPERAPAVGLWADRGRDERIVRDMEAQARLLTGVEWLIDGFPHLGSPTATGRRLASVSMLSGLPMLAFARDALPRLRDQDGVIVTVLGAPIDYREATSAPLITVSGTERAGNRDWLDLAITVSIDGQPVPFDDLFRALAAGDEILILDSGTYLSLDQPELIHLRALIDEARGLQEHGRDGISVNRHHVDLWAELEALGVVDAQASVWRSAVAGLVGTGELPRRAVPAGLEAKLRPYQHEGFTWLAHLRDHNLGGILADDMGLGKTLQVIALMADERLSGSPGEPRAPWLVIAPASVVHNWAVEIARFAPTLRTVVLNETSAKRGVGMAEAIDNADVVITSYTLFRLDFDEFEQRDFVGLILDEAQFVKNHQSKAHGCARRLQAPVKIAVTGTPMENNLMELWSLLSITAPGLFPSPKRFAEFYQRPIERDLDDERLTLLRRRIRPFMLRRTKEQVATELPPKQEQVLELDLHPRHRKIYDTQLQRERQRVLGLLNDMDANRFQIFQSLTLLRQLSLDASLVDEKNVGVPSAKLDALMEMLEDVLAEGHRVLVFSQFTRYLGLARSRLDAVGMRYAYLDGRTRRRDRPIDEFRSGVAPVFLISLKAGGFGLNLTEADYVVLLDPWWNPATEAQAVDRAHRIGQDKHVMVYRLVSRGTIEEKVMALKAEKAALFAGVMSDAGVGGVGITADDIRDLLS